MNSAIIQSWEKGFPDRDAVLFHEGGREFTVGNMAEDMQSGTELGEALGFGLFEHFAQLQKDTKGDVVSVMNASCA